MGNLIKVTKAAKILGVTRQSLYNWWRDGKIEFVKSPGGQNFIDEDILNSLFKKNIKNNLKEDGNEGQ